MKCALFHNFLDNIGGAEMVTLTLARELDAPIFTTNIDRNKIDAMGFSDVEVRSIGRVPINAPFRQQFALLRFLFFKDTEHRDCYVISGDWAMSGAFRNKPAIWYVHSPIREVWDLADYIRTNLIPWYKRPLFDVFVIVNRILNRWLVRHVARCVCNSKNVQNRLKRFLKRDSAIVHPPIETGRYRYRPAEGYWLSVNRLFHHKRIELQLETFRSMPDKRLIIVGSYEKAHHFTEYAKRMQDMAPSNVEFRSWVTDEELRELYGGCIGFVTTARDEDFGMTVVEAMAAGKPVLAPNEGGYRETVVDGQTGILIDDIDADTLRTAIYELEKKAVNMRGACEERARAFDSDIFTETMRKEIMQCINSQ